MSTVIIPHLDLVINMIEKNIFRPLPILKKAGLPGEGVGMEEVILILILGIITSRPSVATFTTCLLILFATYCQWFSWCKSIKSSYHTFFYSIILRTFRFWRTKIKIIFKEHFAQTLCQISSQKKNDQKSYQWLFLQFDSWNIQI